jgi:glycosyltransferase involved in cell wall biosynthesis
MNHIDQTKKILIISLFYSPDTRVGGKRFSFLSRIFQKRCSDLHVLTLKEKYLPEQDNSLSGTGIIHRTGMYPAYPFNKNTAFKRILNRLWVEYLCFFDPFSGWMLPAIFKGLKIVRANKINVIIATGPPFSPMVTAFLISLMTRTKLILDYRDPWSNHDYTNLNPIRKRLNAFIEKWVIRRASAVVFCSRIMMNNFRESLGKHTRATFHIVTNGFVEQNSIKPLSLGNSKKNMVFAGKFYGERSLKLLAKPLAKLLNEGAISTDSFCFHIFGKLRDQDLGIIKKYGLRKIIKEHPWTPHKKILQYLKCADILFLPSGSDVSYAIPFKFFDYLSVERPIFAVAPENSAMAELMNKIDCGRLAFINNEQSIFVNLQTLLLENKEYTYACSREFTWEEIGRKYMRIIDTFS